MDRKDELQRIRIDAAEQLGAVPRVLKELQELVPLLPVAYSIDGRTFGYEAPLSMPVPVGSYVALSVQDGGEYLGQVVTKEVSVRQGAEIGLELDPSLGALLPSGINLSSSHTYPLQRRYAHGSGVVLGKLDGETLVQTTSEDGFQSADLSRADEQLVTRYLSPGTRATLEIGRALHTDGRVRATLRAEGFDRHTFLCGQSGSGKTFALGVILERLLLHTDLRIIVLDPNSDFAGLDRMRPLADVNRTRSSDLAPESYGEISERYWKLARGLKIVRPAPYADDFSEPLRIRFSDLERHEQGLVLEMDPLRDREEFNVYWRIIEGLSNERYSLSEVKEAAGRQFSAEARQLGLRIENLGVTDWGLWCAADELSLVDVLKEDWRCLVVDSGTLASPAEQSIVAMAVLGHLWRNRHGRQPVLVVADEAHNICPQDPTDNLEAAVTNHAIKIAGEGRKFGLYLLVATQRPSKIHANVLSQCDNLILMKMNSISDLAHVSRIFSQAPTTFLDQSPHFAQGQCLLAGKIVHNPTFGGFEGRFSEEGEPTYPLPGQLRRTVADERRARYFHTDEDHCYSELTVTWDLCFAMSAAITPTREKSSFGRVLLVLAATIVVLAGMRLGAPILNPILFAVVLSLIFSPLYSWLRRRGLPTPLALLVMLVGLTVFFVALFAFLSVSINKFTGRVAFYTTQLGIRTDEIQTLLERLRVSNVDLREVVDPGALVGALGSVLSGISSFLSYLFLILMITLFLLGEGPVMMDRLRASVAQDNPQFARLKVVGRGVVRQLGLRAITNFAIGAGLTVVFFLSGVDFPLLWGVLAFFLSFVPYIGLPIAAAPGVLLALAEFGLGRAIVVILGVVVINQLAEYGLDPILLSRGLQVSPTVVFLSFTVWVWLLGIPGAFLTMPITLLLAAMFGTFPETRWLTGLMTTGPPTDAPAPSVEVERT